MIDLRDQKLEFTASFWQQGRHWPYYPWASGTARFQVAGPSRRNAAPNISSLGTRPVLFGSCLTTSPPLSWPHAKVT